jgi:hypothetical protein
MVDVHEFGCSLQDIAACLLNILDPFFDRSGERSELV